MEELSFLATPNGLEPSTSSVTGWRANRLHHRAIFYGGNNRARTCDLLLVRQMLSQLSYAPKPRRLCVSHISDEARTRYLHLGKVALYRMSYARISVPCWEPWCLRSELNQRHADFQSAALPTELPRRALYKTVVGTTGLEPVTPCL